MGAESRIEALADVPRCPFAKQPRTGALPWGPCAPRQWSHRVDGCRSAIPCLLDRWQHGSRLTSLVCASSALLLEARCTVTSLPRRSAAVLRAGAATTSVLTGLSPQLSFRQQPRTGLPRPFASNLVRVSPVRVSPGTGMIRAISSLTNGGESPPTGTTQSGHAKAVIGRLLHSRALRYRQGRGTTSERLHLCL